MFRGEDHQDSVGAEVVHHVPVIGAEDQTFVGRIENERVVLLAVIVRDGAATVKTNRSLYSFLMSVFSADGTIHAVNVKNSPDVEGQDLFDYREVAARVTKCLQIDQMGHQRVFRSWERR